MPRVIRFHQLGENDVLKIEEEPPHEPGPGEVRIKVRSLALNRADIIFRRGVYPEKPKLPSGLGYDACGVIDALGAGVSGLKIGDRVSTFTNFALRDYTVHGESAVVPATGVTPTPKTLSDEEGAAFWNPFLTAYLSLVEEGGLQAGDTVLWPAASSSIGAAAVQICKLFGARFIGTTRTAAKKELLKAWGADEVIVTEEEDLVARVTELTGGKGVNVLVDSVGGPEFEKYGQIMAVRGRLISIGSLTRQAPVYPMQFAMVKMYTYSVMTVFKYTGNAHFNCTEDPRAVARAKRLILDGLALGHLKPTVGKVFKGLDEYVEATKFVEANLNSGKVVVAL